MKLDWNDRNSIRAWLQDEITAMRGFAEMLSLLADDMDRAMPPAEAAPEAPPKTGGLETPAHSPGGSSKVPRVIAEMIISFARMTEAAMPPAEAPPAAPTPAGAPGTRACSLCGKSEAETQLYAGAQGDVCPPCTRAACGVLGIALDEGKGKPAGD